MDQYKVTSGEAPLVLDGFQRVAVRVDFTGVKSLTKQSFRDECDANSIMARWHKTGQVDHINSNPPRYGDFDTADSYLEALLKVQAAEAEFQNLSAEVRDRMNNDPAVFMGFMQDPENLDEAVELGLVQKPAPPPVDKTPPETPPAEVPPSPPPSPVAGGE